MMLFMNYSAYLPFQKLMIALEDKGFVDKGSRPTIKKVVSLMCVCMCVCVCVRARVGACVCVCGLQTGSCE
jgi:hypothetical protein